MLSLLIKCQTAHLRKRLWQSTVPTPNPKLNIIKLFKTQIFSCSTFALFTLSTPPNSGSLSFYLFLALFLFAFSAVLIFFEYFASRFIIFVCACCRALLLVRISESGGRPEFLLMVTFAFFFGFLVSFFSNFWRVSRKECSRFSSSPPCRQRNMLSRVVDGKIN